MSVFTSVRARLLAVFAGSLTAVALVTVGMSAYLAVRHGEADARTRLARSLIQLQDELESARNDLRTVALQTAADAKNLSDLATLYSEERMLERSYDDVRERALRVHKAASVSRLRVVVRSARLSNVAVYVDGVLSHYIDGEEAGLAIRNGTNRAVVRLDDDADNRAWLDGAHPDAVAAGAVPRLPDVVPMTVQFVFPARDEMELSVVVPIQAVTRTAFDATIAEHLSIARAGAPGADASALGRRSDAATRPFGPTAPHVIGAFVFSRRFGRAFLERFAENTGVVPAVLSTDAAHRLELIEMRPPAGLLAGNDGGLPLGLVEAGSGSFYLVTRQWRQEQGLPLVLSAAVSTESTTAGVRRTVALAVIAAAAALILGLVLGSASIGRMVTPIKALTGAAASMGVAAASGSPGREPDAALHAALGRYLDAPVGPSSADEVGTLTRAFNAMAARLHELIDRLQVSNEALERANDALRGAETEVQALNVGLEQQVRDRTEQLAIANKELESFSYSVSHDLRAPLRGIDGFSRALLEDYGTVLDDTGRDYLMRIRRASQQMGQLIDDLIDMARVTRSELVRVHVDLSAMALGIMEELRASEPSRVFDVSVAPGLEASGDQRLLEIVLRNLLNNACKFTSTRAIARIECGQILRDGERTFFVRDNGVGFDDAYTHKLFGAFQRLHYASEFPGTGIGLATVHRIVQRHGGRVAAEGRLDEGATFYFTVPGAAEGPS